jgi:hypothetical protein
VTKKKKFIAIEPRPAHPGNETNEPASVRTGENLKNKLERFTPAKFFFWTV